MFLKHDVNPQTVLQPETIYGLAIADFYHRMIFKRPVTITSTTDSNLHCKNSAHYTGHAVDLRTRDADAGRCAQWLDMVERELTPLGFHVLEESDHLHLSWNPKNGEVLYEKLS